jgi:thiamine kinase-like enzyme
MLKKLSKYHNNPNLIAPYFIHMEDILNGRPEGNKTVYEILKTILPLLVHDTIVASDLSISPIEGGLSNNLLLLSVPSISHNKTNGITQVNQTIQLLIRIQGVTHEESNDRKTIQYSEPEIACHLSDNGMGPQCYGRFMNGRIEEFYPNMRTLTCREILNPLFNREIANHMAKFHLTKFSHKFDSISSDNNTNNELKGEIWARVDGWIQKALTYSSQRERKVDPHLIHDICTQWKWIQSSFRNRFKNMSKLKQERNHHYHWKHRVQEYCSELVFAHMDLQSLNILTPSKRDHDCDSPIIRIIDFEYSGWNSRAVDIANTFCECCDMNNLKANYESQYPTNDDQKIFFRQYIRSCDEKLAKRLDDCLAWESFLINMISEVGKYSVISHIGWAAWSLCQAIESSIDFDYVIYAKVRLEGYWFSKRKFWDSHS